jgi:antitoxin MazE
MRISKFGDCLAVVLPAEAVAAMDAKEGDEVSVIPVANGRKLEVVWERAPEMSKEEFLANVRRFRGAFPPGFKFDREDANARR